MWLSSLMLTGTISNSDDFVVIEIVIIKARYKSGLIFDPGQVRIFRIIYLKSDILVKY
ncbi:hypothetical protein HanHA300_Chr00c0294g0740021 [Helianthus annuus]|nr:hypothetical protein HanHA89_Chr12g0461511 [Helianthus annuus]KAJ0630378.1 hypothetical protein HanHA300_Chr00c0294g0740021 [Helianthus annuus]KAJ0674367.1 hypothetical protein HanLR1_Chr12g0439161 [Helianthus annuus]